MQITDYGRRPDDLGVPSAGREVPVSQVEDTGGSLDLDLGIIGQKEVDLALAELQKYKDGKQYLEQQIVENELWYQARHWELIRSKNQTQEPEPTSAWLFNTLQNKHADAMDYFPCPNVLPRESRDEATAKLLGKIVPVIEAQAHFEQTYRLNWWEKLKHGCAVYMPRWDTTLYNGLGDIAIDRIDLLNIFWQPGIENIQDSRNVFVVTLEDNDLLEQEYPELKNMLGAGNGGIEVKKYVYQDNIDVTNKTAVVDWYYKIRQNGRTILHYCKICAGKLLFASQNRPEYQDVGWYAHGKYPFVLDTLFPIKGFPTGFGFISICRDPQLYIDKINANIMETTLINSKVRFVVSDDIDINEEELLDNHRAVVKASGGVPLTQDNLYQIKGAPLDSAVTNVVEMKINEMKETSANRDFSQGGTSGGVTAASAIAALQEAGNKVSRDMIFGSYDAYKDITYMVVELAGQFYTEEREFRIVGPDGQYQFEKLSTHIMQTDSRAPIFDIEIKPQRRSPFVREAQNQRAMEFYTAGFFAPENATASLACLEMMDFEGVEQVRAKIAEGQTLQMQLQQSRSVIVGLLKELDLQTGGAVVAGAMAQQNQNPGSGGGGNTLPGRMAQAQRPRPVGVGGV